MTENPRVGGSIPPLGTISIDFQTVTLWVAQGLMARVSYAVDLALIYIMHTHTGASPESSQVVNTGFPNTFISGSTPSPGALEACMKPPLTVGPPSAIEIV